MKSRNKCRSYLINSFNWNNLWTFTWIIKLMNFEFHVDTKLTFRFWFQTKKNFRVWSRERFYVSWMILVYHFQILILEIFFFSSSYQWSFLRLIIIRKLQLSILNQLRQTLSWTLLLLSLPMFRETLSWF